MLGQGALDLGRRHPHATRLDHVVGAAGVPETAGRVLPVLVSSADPLAHEGLLRTLVLVPVAGARAVPLDEQIADFARRDRAAGLVHDHRVVPGYQCAARARADLAAPVRNECMAHLGRPDAVENLEPESLEPAVVNRLRQRLTRGQAEAHRPEVVQPFGVRDLEHRGEGGRYREEQGRPLARENLEHLCRLGAPGVEHGRGAHVEREIQGVAEPVGEEQPGHGEAAVVRADLQYVPPERLAADDHVVVQVHGGLGRTRRTGRVQPEGDVVLGRVRRVELVRLRGHELGQPDLPRPGPARHHELPQEPEMRPDRFDRRCQVLAGDDDRGAAVVQDVLVIARLEERVRRHRHGADLQRTPKRVHELGTVGQQQQHALLHADTEPSQRVAAAVGAGPHLAVRDIPAAAANGEPAGAAFRDVAVDEPGGGVAGAGDVHGSC